MHIIIHIIATDLQEMFIMGRNSIVLESGIVKDQIVNYKIYKISYMTCTTSVRDWTPMGYADCVRAGSDIRQWTVRITTRNLLQTR